MEEANVIDMSNCSRFSRTCREERVFGLPPGGQLQPCLLLEDNNTPWFQCN